MGSIRYRLWFVASLASFWLVACAEEPSPKAKTPMDAYLSTGTPRTPAASSPPDEAGPTRQDRERAEKARAQKQDAIQIEQDRLIHKCDNYPLPEPCRLAGENIIDGKLSEVDGSLADQLFTRACNLGDVLSCLHLSLLLREGKIVPRSLARAAAVTAQGCRLGYDPLCALGALDVWDGAIEPPNHLAALKVLSSNCIKDGAESCYIFAGFMEQGELGPEGVRDAPSFFGKACRLGSKRACEHIDKARKTPR